MCVEPTASLAVTADPDIPPLRARADALSARLRLPLASPVEGPHDLLLVVTETRLELRESGPRAAGPVFVDFAAACFERRRRSGLSGELLARAIGFKGEPLDLVDATAGLGGDMFVLASLGCRVTAIERSPVLAALLEDGLARAAAHPILASVVRERVRFIEGDARLVLPLLESRPDVTYIDPMFPAKPRGRLSRKEMRLCRLAAGGDADAQDLLDAALPATRRRVVVKRAGRGTSLRPKPDFSYRGTTIRYDVYVPATGEPDAFG
jgi:16S rRNA (guanine1516-N2)-methyltransferase